MSARYKKSYKNTLEDMRFTNTYVMAMLYNWLYYNPNFKPAEGKEEKLCLKSFGNYAYGFFSNNDNLDVNAPPHVRHDLYALNSEVDKMRLMGTILEGERGNRVYIYNEPEEKLEYISKYQTIDDAKSALLVIAMVKGK